MACAPFAMLASHDVVTPEARSVTPHDLERQAELRARRNEFIRASVLPVMGSTGRNQFIMASWAQSLNHRRFESSESLRNSMLPAGSRAGHIESLRFLILPAQLPAGSITKPKAFNTSSSTAELEVLKT